MISGSECAAIPGTAGFNIPKLLNSIDQGSRIGCHGGSVCTFVTGWRAKYPLVPSYI